MGPSERVELVGRVVPLRTLTAPLSGRACVLYVLGLTACQRLLERRWGRPGRETVWARFLVHCRLGPVLVDPARARLGLGRGRRHRVALGADPARDASLRLFYRELARPLPRRRVACREQHLRPAQRIWLRGPLSLVPDPRGLPSGYREPPRLPLLLAHELRVL